MALALSSVEKITRPGLDSGVFGKIVTFADGTNWANRTTGLQIRS